MTPAPVARFMASLFQNFEGEEVRLLDAGAGTGALTAAFVEETCRRQVRPARIFVTLYEPDSLLSKYLDKTLVQCHDECVQSGILFEAQSFREDFVRAATAALQGGLFYDKPRFFTHAILNPPYKKIASDSEHRRLLRTAGVETSNLYAAFLALAVKLLAQGGEIVSITPRSFCNGPYFKPFRELLISQISLRRIHVFDSRNKAFQEDEVLQENVIMEGVRGGTPAPVIISSSTDQTFEGMTEWKVAQSQIVHPEDPDLIMHLTASGMDAEVRERLSTFGCSLEDLGIQVSTGPVVDFRLKDYIQNTADSETVPLIYPFHFQGLRVVWPKNPFRKPDFIGNRGEVGRWLMPNGYYVLVRRLSSKEERRRIVASLFEPGAVKSNKIGFENHLNVFHCGQGGLPPELASGLVVYLNSTLVDAFFRQFSGHTQVNAADLRRLPYPSRDDLVLLGTCMSGGKEPDQDTIDAQVEGRLQHMIKRKANDPVRAQRRIEEALSILRLLDFPRAQQNSRSALTLLALLDLKPNNAWADARDPLVGITPIMDFARKHYGKQYAPNTRETFRRQTMHQFVQAGLALSNPDEPERPTNSPNWCYQIEQKALVLLRAFGSPSWDGALEKYLRIRGSLSRRYNREREMRKVPLQISESTSITLTPGKHSKLIKDVLAEFAPRFAPGATVVYIGDTGKKWGYFDEPLLRKLGVTVKTHGKMPDAVLYFAQENWLLLVEAVTSHGPVDPKRRVELQRLFQDAVPGLVYVTAFPSRREMSRYLSEISWETEVWVAEAPTHLIHFNGERFLGPYNE
jgi:adenine-specific DNA-methyltransferase